MKLDEFRKLLEAATPGPWRTHAIYGEDYAELFGPKAGDDRITLGSQADASFIAAMRSMAPKMLAVCEAAKNYRTMEDTRAPEECVPWGDRLDYAIAELEATP